MGKQTIRIGKTIDRNERGFINKHVTNNGKVWYYVFSQVEAEIAEDNSMTPSCVGRYEHLKTARIHIGKEA